MYTGASAPAVDPLARMQHCPLGSVGAVIPATKRVTPRHKRVTPSYKRGTPVHRAVPAERGGRARPRFRSRYVYVCVYM